MKSVALAALATGLVFAPPAGAEPRPLICQLLDLGLAPGTVRAVLAYEDYVPGSGMPYPPSGGMYTGIYYTTVGQQCPEYCDGVEC